MKHEALRDEASFDPSNLAQVGNDAALGGGNGREVFFRPHRHPRSELGPLAVTVEMTIDGRLWPAELVDVSESGAAFLCPAGVSLEIGVTLPELAVRFDEHEAYRGAARVSSLRRTAPGTIAGISFRDGALDIEAILQLRDVRGWSGRAGSPGRDVVRAPWRVAGHDRFKSSVAELRLFLADSRERLGELESALPWSTTHGEEASPARDALIARVGRELANDVVAYSGDLDAALRTASHGERDALREFSCRHLHETLMQAPWMHRARHKPLGYPGDFEVMNFVYRNRFSGPTLFAKALSLAFLCTPAGEAVRTRKDLIKARLRALCDDATLDAPLRILSIASGPAQEIFELLEEGRLGRRPLDIVLLDQDQRALSYAHGRLRSLGVRRQGGEVRIVYLRASIKRLLLDADFLQGHGPFDAVYSCGLFDYLQTRTATALCRSLYALLAPGGTLYVGNMVPANPSRWFMELHLDWFLHYREVAELLEIGRTAASDAHVEILEEETRVNPFVTLTRA